MLHLETSSSSHFVADPGVDDADEGAVHPEVEPQQAEEARRHHALETGRGEFCENTEFSDYHVNVEFFHLKYTIKRR